MEIEPATSVARRSGIFGFQRLQIDLGRSFDGEGLYGARAIRVSRNRFGSFLGLPIVQYRGAVGVFVIVGGADGFSSGATFAIGKAQHPCARDLVTAIAKRKTRPDPDEHRLAGHRELETGSAGFNASLPNRASHIAYVSSLCPADESVSCRSSLNNSEGYAQIVLIYQRL
jgi:hypothetical protein